MSDERLSPWRGRQAEEEAQAQRWLAEERAKEDAFRRLPAWRRAVAHTRTIAFGLLFPLGFFALILGHGSCQAWLNDHPKVRVDKGIERVTSEDEMRLYQEEEIIVPEKGGN